MDVSMSIEFSSTFISDSLEGNEWQASFFLSPPYLLSATQNLNYSNHEDFIFVKWMLITITVILWFRMRTIYIFGFWPCSRSQVLKTLDISWESDKAVFCCICEVTGQHLRIGKANLLLEISVLPPSLGEGQGLAIESYH